MSQKKLKIALLGDTLANGGAERIHSTLSLYFTKQKFEVINVINLNEISYPYGGKLINLGIYLKEGQSIKAKLTRLLKFIQIIKREKFDVIIDFRTRSKPLTEILLSTLLFSTNYIPMVHSSYLPWYFTTNKTIGKLIYKRKKAIITVCESIEKKVKEEYPYKQVETIYNPIDLSLIEEKSLEKNPVILSKYIVGCGSMHTDLKQFDRLIDAYIQSNLYQNEIHLIIIGEGKERAKLEQYVIKKRFTNWIHLVGFIENPFPFFKNAEYFVHSSRLEGFPTVFLEALACGTPVVSLDCPTGPSEIIKEEYNGLLVPAQDFTQLSATMNRLLNEPELLKALKENARESVQRFSIETIGQEWMKLLNKLQD